MTRGEINSSIKMTIRNRKKKKKKKTELEFRMIYFRDDRIIDAEI